MDLDVAVETANFQVAHGVGPAFRNRDYVMHVQRMRRVAPLTAIVRLRKCSRPDVMRP
jgi:hypothetical protein